MLRVVYSGGVSGACYIAVVLVVEYSGGGGVSVSGGI